ncbi:MAG: uridine kinase [Bryobacteraceae bacterium]
MKPLLIGIAGPSCAGKSELARRLAVVLPATALSLDRYYRDLSHLAPEQRASWNFDVPEALELELLAGHLEALAQGKPIEVPVYDFTQHVRKPVREKLLPGGHVLVEGLFALLDERVRRLLDFGIFVEAPDDVCLTRRIERDVRERGRTPESVRRQYEETVRPMARRYILPTRAYADLALDGTQPPEALVQRVLAALAARGLWAPPAGN